MSLFCIGWNMWGVVHEKLLQHRIPNPCLQWWSNRTLHQKHPTLVNRKSIILQHDKWCKVRLYKMSSRKKKKKMAYSLDLAPNDLYLLFRSPEYFISGRTSRNKDIGKSLSNFFFFTFKSLDFIECGGLGVGFPFPLDCRQWKWKRLQFW